MPGKRVGERSGRPGAYALAVAVNLALLACKCKQRWFNRLPMSLIRGECGGVMPNLRVNRQVAIRALAGEVRKRTAQRESELAKYPAVLDSKRAQLVGKLEKVVAALRAAKTSEAIADVINKNDLGYSWRKDIPSKPANGACSHARMLKQLQMDAREIIPVGEKDVLWTLLVAQCEI